MWETFIILDQMNWRIVCSTYLFLYQDIIKNMLPLNYFKQGLCTNFQLSFSSSTKMAALSATSGDTQQPMSLQEPLATMRNAPIIMKVCEVMEQLGWKPYEVSGHPLGVGDCWVYRERSWLRF